MSDQLQFFGRALGFLAGQFCAKVEQSSCRLWVDMHRTISVEAMYLCVQMAYTVSVGYPSERQLKNIANARIVEAVKRNIGVRGMRDNEDVIPVLQDSFQQVVRNKKIFVRLPDEDTLKGALNIGSFASLKSLGAVRCPVVVECTAFGYSSIVDFGAAENPKLRALLDEEVLENAISAAAGNCVPMRSFF